MQSENNLIRTTKQVLPADGWRVVWECENGELDCEPLVCWALVETIYAGERLDEVVGMASDGEITYLVDEQDGFVGYLAPGESVHLKFGKAQQIVARERHQCEQRCN